MTPRDRSHHSDQNEQYEDRINAGILSTMNPPDEPPEEEDPPNDSGRQSDEEN